RSSRRKAPVRGPAWGSLRSTESSTSPVDTSRYARRSERGLHSRSTCHRRTYRRGLRNPDPLLRLPRGGRRQSSSCRTMRAFGRGGRLVAEQVAAFHPHMRVLFVSGYTDDAVVRHGVLQEGVNFLQKPFSPVALAHKVREILDSPR